MHTYLCDFGLSLSRTGGLTVRCFKTPPDLREYDCDVNCCCKISCSGSSCLCRGCVRCRCVAAHVMWRRRRRCGRLGTAIRFVLQRARPTIAMQMSQSSSDMGVVVLVSTPPRTVRHVAGSSTPSLLPSLHRTKTKTKL